jgi:hypothetical protein
MNVIDLSRAYVYCHIKADNNEPFYVGIGQTRYRPWDLKTGRSKWHNDTVKKHGVRVEIIIDDLDRDTAKFWEIRWIKALRDQGYKLVNMTNGGDGLNGMSHSGESRLKNSLSHLAKGDAHHNKSPEHRAKNSAGQKANSKNHIMKLTENREWKKQEWEEKFGGSPMLVPEIAAKARKTMLAKGLNHQCKRPEVRAKIKQSCGMYLSWFSSNAKWQYYWGS